MGAHQPPLPDAPLVIPPAIVERMQDHTFAEYPGECCGLLFAPVDEETATGVLPLENVQDRLHALDPESHPRTSRNGFHMDAMRVCREVEAAVARGERLLAFFHSHIDCDPYFSQEDRDMAAPPPWRTPVYPDVWHVVIACWPDGIRAARAFRWDGRDFAPGALRGFARAAVLPRRS